ncbi:MAG: EF-Tu/IF-2/RF-3 family GTPase, partial [Thermodesulfovibrionales bacterium]
FIDLDATEEQLDFPVVYTNAKRGVATLDLKDDSDDLRPLFDLIIKTIPAPEGNRDGILQILVTNIDYNDYVGRLAIGRVFSGTVKIGDAVSVVNDKGDRVKTKITSIYEFQGLERIETREATIGDIIALAGIEGINIGDTITDSEKPRPLPRIKIDEPTISMVFSVNTSPFAGKEGRFVTSRNLR